MADPIPPAEQSPTEAATTGYSFATKAAAKWLALCDDQKSDLRGEIATAFLAIEAEARATPPAAAPFTVYDRETRNAIGDQSSLAVAYEGAAPPATNRLREALDRHAARILAITVQETLPARLRQELQDIAIAIRAVLASAPTDGLRAALERLLIYAEANTPDGPTPGALREARAALASAPVSDGRVEPMEVMDRLIQLHGCADGDTGIPCAHHSAERAFYARLSTTEATE